MPPSYLKDSQGNQLNAITPGAVDLDGNGSIDLPEEQVPIGTDVVSLGGNSIAALGNARNRVPNPTVTLTSITSNEPDDGLGDGDTANDIQLGATDFDFFVRAERSGLGDGRIYTVTYTVTDGSGNSASASATITVPKSAAN